MKKTILFGGSFDPIHEGHLVLASNALNELQADEVLFVLSPLARWKETTTTVEDRIAMINLVIRDNPKFSLSLIEIERKGEIYTYDTVKEYLDTHEDEEVYLLIGTDQVQKFDNWYKASELAKISKIVYYKRDLYEVDEKVVNKYHMKAIEGKTIDVSSSAIRNLNVKHCPKPVLEYIGNHRLYYVADLAKMITEKRLNHSLRVSSLAYDIAFNNNYPVEKAYIAGILHDSSKHIAIESQIILINQHFGSQIVQDIEVPLYHQFSGAIIAKEKFGINDEEILDAIKYHATGKANMSVLGRIIYAADKIEPGRDFDSGELINACIKDINIGFIRVLEDNVKYFRTKGIKYQNYLTLECIKYYLKGGRCMKEIKLEAIVKAISDKKGENIVTIDVSNRSPFCEYYVLCNVSTSRQADAIVSAIEETLANLKQTVHHIEGNNKSDWILIDCNEIVVHIFTEEERKRIDLETLLSGEKMIHYEGK